MSSSCRGSQSGGTVIYFYLFQNVINEFQKYLIHVEIVLGAGFTEPHPGYLLCKLRRHVPAVTCSTTQTRLCFTTKGGGAQGRYTPIYVQISGSCVQQISVAIHITKPLETFKSYYACESLNVQCTWHLKYEFQCFFMIGSLAGKKSSKQILQPKNIVSVQNVNLHNNTVDTNVLLPSASNGSKKEVSEQAEGCAWHSLRVTSTWATAGHPHSRTFSPCCLEISLSASQSSLFPTRRSSASSEAYCGVVRDVTHGQANSNAHLSPVTNCSFSPLPLSTSWGGQGPRCFGKYLLRGMNNYHGHGPGLGPSHS